MATIYLTLGCTGKAGVMFSLGKQLAESPKCTGSIKQLFLSHYARYLASIGNTEKSLAMIAQVDPFSSEIARDDLSLLQRARACLDKSFVSFSQGTFVEACAYFTKGLDAARDVRSDGWSIQFSAALADLKARQAQPVDSTNHFKAATEKASKVTSHLPAMLVANLMVVEADLQKCDGSLSKALATYEDAGAELSRAANEKLISRLEDLPIVE
eukprot:jgi/Hompol1/2362/HPOL_005783-RA